MQRMGDPPDEQDAQALSPWAEQVLTQQVNRRRFLTRAAVIGLTATTATSFLAACEQLATPTPLPVHTPMPTAFPTPTPFATPTPRPTATPTLAPTPTPTPVPPQALATEDARVRHLLRRAGFGANAAELAEFRAMGLQATIDHLVDFDGIDNSALEERLAAQDIDFERLAHIQRWWLQRMAYTARPLEEKMTLFWHGILTSSFRKTGSGPAMYNQNVLFRDMGMGSYNVMLKVVSRDPAMLIYLDSRTNVKGNPNENYSRELMELFTLGIGNYTEDDVRESARAFTGSRVRGQETFIFNERQHDFDDKTFLGQTGNWNIDDAVDIITSQPVAAEYITRRLWEFFAYPDPEPTIVARLAAIFRANDTKIRPVVRAIFESDEFYSPRAANALVKGPAELVASTVRSLGVDTNFAPLTNHVTAMGQELFAPPNVAGWDGGAVWINSATLLERINLANVMSTARRSRLVFDPTRLIDADRATSPSTVVDYFVDLLLGGDVEPATRDALEAYLREIRVPSRSTGRIAPFDEQLRGLVYLVLASPGYQVA